MPAKQTMCIWGDSGTGKTHLLATAAEGFHQATGKKVRLVTAESAQSQSMMSGLIERGVVESWFLDAKREVPFERIWQACSGYWPLDPNEPQSPLLPAFTLQYKAFCEKHPTKVAYQSEKAPGAADTSKLVCPECKEPLFLRTERIPNKKNGIDQVGMYLFEGLSEFGNMMMSNMAKRTANGEKLGGDAAVRFQDGELWIGGATQSHYGSAQSQCKERVEDSRHLIGIDYVIWTARRADDKDMKNQRAGRVYGPKVPGTAATGDIPSWFGPTLGTALVPLADSAEYRLYLTTYFQTWDTLDAKVPNLCNNRIPPHQLKKAKDKLGKVVQTTGLPLNGNGPVPDYIVVDADDTTLLWKVLKMIEERQKAPVLPVKPTVVASASVPIVGVK